MKQEDKELLLKDLCARLPYKVKISANNNTATLCGIDENVVIARQDRRRYKEEFILAVGNDVDIVKPYLRPMSSMTEEEKKIYDHRLECMFYDNAYDDAFAIDWLNSNHFDYRGLIDKGLALEAPEGMYEIK